MPFSRVASAFRVLGPLEVVHRGQVRDVPAGRQQAVLVSLLLRPNETVPASTLVEQVWGENADRSVLNVCVMRLRRSLRDSDHELVRADANGYRIVVDESAVDLHRFRRLCAQGAQARARGDRDGERVALHEGLALWRGDAFAGIVSPLLQSEVVPILEEERLAAVERRVDADLECGAHAEVIRELRQLVADHPFRERFWCQLLLALYRSGRQSEALDAYLRARRRLTEELGVEPGEELRELHRRILTSDPTLPVRPPAAEPASWTMPAQLPPAVAGFGGRREQLYRLDRMLEREDRSPATVITGPPGVGKTALAVHWSSRNRHRWPDGQLHIDLRGYGPEAPVRPIEALAYFLRAIGVPGEQVPGDLTQASALFRSLTADRHMLILLDNAATTKQVRPVLPGGDTCTVIVTSRDRLTGLLVNEGARALSLDVMADVEARTLLADAVGTERCLAEPETVDELARLCGNLPLALRITAADLTGHPQRSLTDHVAMLRGGNRLDALQVAEDDGTAVRAVFQSSYARLPEAARRMFRLLGLFPGAEISLDCAAALADNEPAAVSRLLDRLVSAHLVAPRGAGRFALHDLLRLFAAELAQQQDVETERDAAIQRLYDHYTRTIESVAQRLFPQLIRLPLSADAARLPAEPFDDGDALEWLDTEWHNLVAAVRYAAEHGPRLDACRLAAAVRGYLHTKVHVVDGLTVARAALTAARDIGHSRAEALAYLCLADLHRFTGEHRTSIQHYEQMLARARHEDWLEGQAAAHNNLGDMLRIKGRLRSAADHLFKALDLHRRVEHIAGQAVSLGNLGRVRLQMGEIAAAVIDLRDSLPLHQQIGALSGRGRIMASLGEALNILGEHDEAREVLLEAADIHREFDDRPYLPYSLSGLAAVHLAIGQYIPALELATESIALSREISGGQSTEAQSLCVIAAIDQAEGRHDSSLEQYRRACSLTAASGQGYIQVQALIGMAKLCRETGRRKQARHHIDRAIAMAHRCDYRLWERHAAAIKATLT